MLKKLLKNLLPVFMLLLFISSFCWGQIPDDKLKIDYKGNAKIEVGGPYAGIEIHHSSPLLQRISFFYPVANSLDESTDYWKRDTSFIMQLGLKSGDGPKEFIGREPFEFTLTPYSVVFHKQDADKSLAVSYTFTGSKPALVVKYEIKNKRAEVTPFEFYTDLETAIGQVILSILFIRHGRNTTAVFRQSTQILMILRRKMLRFLLLMRVKNHPRSVQPAD